MPPIIPGTGALTDPLPGNILDNPNYWSLFRTTRYIDKDGSPETNLFPDRGQIIRTVYVAHGNVDQAISDFYGLGTVKLDLARNYRYISRVIPHNYPKRPWMWVQGINSVMPQASRARNPDGNTLADFQGRDTDDTPLYEVAEVQLQYIMPTFKIKDDDDVTDNTDGSPYQGLPDEAQALMKGYTTYSRYITRIPKMMSKMLTVPRGLLSDSNRKVVAENIAINEHVSEWIYTWHQVPEEALPEVTWIAGANSVNDAVFDGRPAGTLLFAGEPDVKLTPNPITGQVLYDVTYRFHSLLIFDPADPTNPKGHNYIRRNDPSTPGNPFRPLSVGFWFTPPGGFLQQSKIFPSFDFRKLFRPDQI